jgi:hypothetical protein
MAIRKENEITEAAAPEVAEVAQAAKPKRRRKRVGFGGFRQKLHVPALLAGYHMHIFNDDDKMRIQQALNAGYTFVEPEEVGIESPTGGDISENRVSWVVGTDDRGQPIRGYLMKIEQEYWEEDFRESQKPVDRIEAMLKGTQDQDTDRKDRGKFYGGAKIE